MDYLMGRCEYYRDTKEGKNRMDVNGVGTINTIPDITLVSIGVITSGKELSVVQKENAVITQRVILQIKALGIDDKDIQTQSYNIETIYDYQDGKQIFKEYRVTNNLRITVRDIRLTGIVIDKAVSSGANYVGNIEFTISDTSKYYRRALEKAIADAVQKAEVMATSLGVELERIPLRLTEESFSSAASLITPRAKLLTEDATPIQPGQLEVRASIRIIFSYN